MRPDLLIRRLEERARLAVELPGFQPSAVLVTLLCDEAGSLRDARLLFTVRRADLRRHAGQISFPGGRRDPGDADLRATALREAEEEIGIARERVDVLGFLDDVPTPTGFVITPVVGAVCGPFVPRLQPEEVAEAFTADLVTLREEGCYRDQGRRHFEGVEYVMHEYHTDGRRIWGATARMVHQLLELMAQAD
jgi:8-oxo-dGTP pyrophosphatase MutT (NUDIX family)